MMRTTPMLALAALSLVIVLRPAPAEAGLAVGDRAVDFVGKEFVNSEPFTLADVKGKLLLFEFIGTG